MTHTKRYIALLLTLLCAGVGESVAQTIHTDLVGKYFVSIGTESAWPQDNQWYVIENTSGTNNNTYVEGNSDRLTSVTSECGAADVASRLFKYVQNPTDGNHYLLSGDGYYLTMTASRASAQLGWSTTAGTPIEYIFSDWSTGREVRYYNIRSKSNVQGTKYGFLTCENGVLSVHTSNQTFYSNSVASEFHLHSVTLETRYRVTYVFTYTVGSVEEVVASVVYPKYLPQWSRYPLTDVAELNAFFRNNVSTEILETYEVDETQVPNLANQQVDQDKTVTIPLKLRETKLEQELVYNSPVSLFEGESANLTYYLQVQSPGAHISYAVKAGGEEFVHLDGTRVIADKAGTAHIVATSTYLPTDSRYAIYEPTKTAEIEVVVEGYTPTQKAFVAAYDSLRTYKTVVGSHLGQYTFNGDNRQFIDLLLQYIDMRSEVRAYSDRELRGATAAVRTMRGAMEGEGALVLNLPVPGTLLQMWHEAGAYVQPATVYDEAIRSILYYDDDHRLIAYADGYYVAGEAVATDVSTQGTEYTFTAFNPAQHDGLYKANDLTTTYHLRDINQLPVDISAAGFATLYCPAKLAIPNTLRAYVATGHTASGDIRLERIIGQAPKGSCLVLRGAEGRYLFDVVYDGDDQTLPPSTLLHGTYPKILTADKETGGETVYTLQPTTPVAFHPWPSTDTNSQYITHFKCYYSLPADAGVRAVAVLFPEDADAVEHPTAATPAAKAPIYDLQGRRLAKAPARGLYIQGGRKVGR